MVVWWSGLHMVIFFSARHGGNAVGELYRKRGAASTLRIACALASSVCLVLSLLSGTVFREYRRHAKGIVQDGQVELL